MEIILSKLCKALTGSIEKGFGYHIQGRADLDGKKRFWGVRQSNGKIPSDGHWRFIVLCAEMAQNGLYIKDIRVSGYELKAALQEAAFLASSLKVNVDYEYNADEVLQLKTMLGL